jgi:hypothetical protein
MTTENSAPPGRLRVRFGLGATLVGFLIFVLGANPGFFRVDRSPVVGFLQIAVFLIGLAGICMGGYISLSALWNGGPKTIASDIGQRLVATGYVIAVASGMADVFGFGTQTLPAKTPYFGQWQSWGVMIGEAVITLGFVLLIPLGRPATKPPEPPPQIEIVE